MVVDTGSRAQEPPSEAASPSSSDSFILLPAPTEAPSPLTGYLPYLQADPTRAAGAPRGSQEPPSSGAPYLAEATLQPPLPSSAQACRAASPLVLLTSLPCHPGISLTLLGSSLLAISLPRVGSSVLGGQARLPGRCSGGNWTLLTRPPTSVSATGSTACSVPPRSLSLVCCILLLPTNRCQVSFRGGGRCPTPSLARPRPGPTLRGPRSPTLSDGALGPGPCL